MAGARIGDGGAAHSRSVGRRVKFVILVAVAAGVTSVPATAGAVAASAEVWVAHYSDAYAHRDFARALAVSPDGRTVFVVGVSDREYVTIAYAADSGIKKWVARFNGNQAHTGHDQACCVAVSPDGQLVFVTGYVTGSSPHSDYATIAYDAATGEQRWIARFNDSKNGQDVAYALGVSPDGSRVYVAGSARGRYCLVAYAARSGGQLWVSKRNMYGQPSSLAISPDGSKVFVTGMPDYLTIAYSAATSRRLWTRREVGPGENVANSIAVSPDSRAVFVTGSSMLSEWTYLTVGFDAETGKRIWARRYGTPAYGGSVALDLAVSPDGSTVFVTGGSSGLTSHEDYATIAYDTAAGHIRWARRYNGPGDYMDDAWAIGVSPDGSELFVTGGSSGDGSSVDFATVAYDVASGARLWLKRFNGAGNYVDIASAIVVSPDGSKVFVAGFTSNTLTDTDITTIAYLP